MPETKVDEIERIEEEPLWSVRNLLPTAVSTEVVEKAIELDRLLAVERERGEPQQVRVADPEAFARYTGGAFTTSILDWLGRKEDEAPPWGSHARTRYLDDLWRSEPKVAGVVFSMESRVAAIGWAITGPVDGLRDAWRVFGEAEVTHSWSDLVRPVFRGYATTDLGGVVQIAAGEVEGFPKLYYLPSSRCIHGPVLWQGIAYDLLFEDVSGEWKGLNGPQFWRMCSMPDYDPIMRQLGFCFMSRCCRVAARALKLEDYKDEKLANLPPEGIAAVTGLTKTQVETAITLWKEERKRYQALTFPGVLWLVANVFGQEVKVDVTSFRQVWEGFDERSEAEVYMKTVSLDAGVDVGEFWMIDVTGATRAAQERQHRKALGKGPAEFLVDFERFATRLLPQLYTFEFNEVDDEQDLTVERVREARIKNIRSMWMPDPVSMTGLISTDQAQELLSQWRVVPTRFFAPQESVVTDIVRDLGITMGRIDNDGYTEVYRRYW